jgi:hypothetical protein
MNRAERRRQSKEDEKKLLAGIDPESRAAKPIVVMAQHLHGLFEKAKKSGRVEAPVRFLYDNVTATLAAKPIEVACARGCSHCCNGWVSSSAPEILFFARHARAKGEAFAARLRAAHEATLAFSKEERPKHPHPCSALEDDACGLYTARPMACRLAVSLDAQACMRLFRLFEPGTIPTPMRNLKARELYELAIATALTHAGLSHRYYDLTGGLARVLEREDAEEAWLSGEDVFAGVPMDSIDIMSRSNAQLVYREAFGEAS